MVGKKTTTFDVINITLFVVFALLCAYPLYYLVIYSLSNSTEIARNPAWLLPRGFTLGNYTYLFQKPEILNAVLVSTSRTVLGTIITVFCCSLFAYLLTQKKLVFRRFIYRMLVLTMYLNAGLIPYIIVMRSYHLNNNFLLYILPTAVSAFNVILIKTYMEGLPSSLEEAATIDGAGYFTIFTRVIFPVCLPVVATVAIFSAVSQWNSWQDNFYLVRSRELKTLQLQLLEYRLPPGRRSAAGGDPRHRWRCVGTAHPHPRLAGRQPSHFSERRGARHRYTCKLLHLRTELEPGRHPDLHPEKKLAHNPVHRCHPGGRPGTLRTGVRSAVDGAMWSAAKRLPAGAGGAYHRVRYVPFRPLQTTGPHRNGPVLCSGWPGEHEGEALL